MKKFIIFICVFLCLVGCSNEKPKEPEIPNPNEQKEEEPKQEEKAPVKWIVDPESKTRPYAVMINCHNNALPQSDVNKAYIVYELMVEGGITRMMALYKDADASKIGSVRSARSQYLGYVLENDATYVSAGGSKEGIREVNKLGINRIDVDNSAYGMRDTKLKRDYEHTLFTSIDKLKKASKNYNYRTTTDKGLLLKYSEEELDLSKYKSAIKAENISIKYSDYRTSKYTYDSTNKTYLRFMNNTKNTDLTTGNQYTAKNIIVYGVKYTTFTSDNYYGYQKINNIGSGEGYYITNGYAIPITWSKKDLSSKTIYKIKETKEELVVNNGNTYIQIYPKGNDMKIN